jgi:hypothetical protein
MASMKIAHTMLSHEDYENHLTDSYFLGRHSFTDTRQKPLGIRGELEGGPVRHARIGR